VSTAGLHVPPLVVNIAGQNAWLSVIAGTLATLLMAWLIVSLVLRFGEVSWGLYLKTWLFL